MTAGAGDGDNGDDPESDVTVGDANTVLDELFAVIEDRKQNVPSDSYTASLFTHKRGENAALEKLGEETTELLLAAKDQDTEALTHEAADVIYHLLVVLAMNDVDLEELREELRSRR